MNAQADANTTIAILQLGHARATLETALQQLGGELYSGNMTHPSEVAAVVAHIGREVGLCLLAPDPMDGEGSRTAGYTKEDGLRELGAVAMPGREEPLHPRPAAHPRWPASPWAVCVRLLVDLMHDDEAMAAIRSSQGLARANAAAEIVRIYALACRALENNPLPDPLVPQWQ